MDYIPDSPYPPDRSLRKKASTQVIIKPYFQLAPEIIPVHTPVSKKTLTKRWLVFFSQVGWFKVFGALFALFCALYGLQDLAKKIFSRPGDTDWGE